MGLFDDSYDPEGLAGLSHADLYMLRDQLPQYQGLLAPYEHRAFAREAVSKNPLLALSIATAIPLYQLQKLFGASNARSAPSLDQMTQGYKGIWEGL